VPDPTFEALVERHSAEIYAYLWRLLRDPEQASDALQDTYLRALRAFPRLKHHEHLRAWLYTIATNRARSLVRQRAGHESRQQEMTEEMADLQASVGQRVMDRETRRRVRAAVERLPSKQREALILRRYQGLGYDEIAAIVGGTTAAARMNVHLAQRRLKAWLQPEDEEGRPSRRRGVS